MKLVSERKGQLTRQTLLGSPLKNVPFQLLPLVSHQPDLLESNLAWQNLCAKDWGEDTAVTFVYLVEATSRQLFLEESKDLTMALHSLSIQSSTAFELILIFLDESLAEYFVAHDEMKSLPGKVLALSTKGGCDSPDIFQTLNSIETNGRFVCFLPRGFFLHPSAVFILQKLTFSYLKDAGAIITHELVVSPDLGKPMGFQRRELPQNQNLLFYNAWGSCFLINKTLCKELSCSLPLASFNSQVFSWHIALKLLEQKAKPELLPLGLLCRKHFSLCESQTPAANTHEQDKETILSLSLRCSDLGQKLGYPFHKMVPYASKHQGLLVFRPELPVAEGKVSVVIPFRDQSAYTIHCLQGLAGQTISSDLEICLVDNGSLPQNLDAIKQSADHFFGEEKVILINYQNYFNFARLCNLGAANSTGNFLVMCNNDVEFSEANTLEELRKWATLPQVGAVGVSLLYPDQGVQSSGLIFPGVRPANVHSPGQLPDVTREVCGVSLALCMTTRKVWQQLGGLDENQCPNGFGDALFGKRLMDQGLRNIVCGYLSAIHHESKSRGSKPEELELLELEWAGIPIGANHDDFNPLHQVMYVDYAALSAQRTRSFKQRLLARTARLIKKVF